MATAKQLAARARFAEMARSGALAKKRKAAAKKPRSKKQDLAIAMSEKRAGHPRKAEEFFERAATAKNPKPRKKNPAPATYRQNNPLVEPKTRAQPKTFMNPRDHFPFKVFKAGAKGLPGQIIGAFKTRAIAESFAHGYANLHKCPVVVVGD